MYNSCSFSGHRLVGNDLDKALLARVTENLIIYQKTQIFYCGMAQGFDLIAAETVLNLKKKYSHIQLIACVPHQGQSVYFSSKDKIAYKNILSRCDEVKVFSDYYFNGCMQLRDRYMVDHSDVLVCFLRENSGGTYYTVNYAKKNGKAVIEI